MYKKFRKSNIFIFLFGLFFASLISHPFPEHLNGKDSFVMASITQLIITNGNCNYLISIFSYMGLYPKSYPIGPQMYTAALSVIVNLNIEISTGIYSILVFVLAFSSSFFLGHCFSRKTIGGFFTAVLYVSAPVITGFLGNWNFSTRVLILTFSPLILLLFLKYLRENDRRFVALSFLILFLSLTFHRTAYFLLILVVVYFISLIYRSVSNRSRIESFLKKWNRSFFYLVSSIIFAVYFSPILFGRYVYLHGERLVENPSFRIIDNDSAISVFVNLGANYAMAFGLCSVFILFGYFNLSKNFLRSSSNIFILTLILFSGFIWVELTYARPFLMILLALLSSSGLIHSINYFKPYANKSTLYIIFATLLILSQLAPMFLVINDTTSDNTDIYTEEQIRNLYLLSNNSPSETIDASNFLRVHRSEEALFSNYYSVEIQVRTFSSMEPIGNAYRIEEYESYTPVLNQTNLIQILLGKKIELGVTEGPDYPKIQYSVFYNSRDTSDMYYSKALEYIVGGPGDYYVLIVLPSSDRLVWNPDQSFFLINLQEENYKTYENSLLAFTYFSTK